MTRATKHNGGGYPRGIPRRSPTPFPKKGIHIRLPADDYALIKTVATGAKMNMNEFITTAALDRAKSLGGGIS